MQPFAAANAAASSSVTAGVPSSAFVATIILTTPSECWSTSYERGGMRRAAWKCSVRRAAWKRRVETRGNAV
eukprot:6490419-Prymnesium_polylepis.4